MVKFVTFTDKQADAWKMFANSLKSRGAYMQLLALVHDDTMPMPFRKVALYFLLEYSILARKLYLWKFKALNYLNLKNRSIIADAEEFPAELLEYAVDLIVHFVGELRPYTNDKKGNNSALEFYNQVILELFDIVAFGEEDIWKQLTSSYVSFLPGHGFDPLITFLSQESIHDKWKTRLDEYVRHYLQGGGNLQNELVIADKLGVDLLSRYAQAVIKRDSSTQYSSELFRKQLRFLLHESRFTNSETRGFFIAPERLYSILSTLARAADSNLFNETCRLLLLPHATLYLADNKIAEFLARHRLLIGYEVRQSISQAMAAMESARSAIPLPDERLEKALEAMRLAE